MKNSMIAVIGIVTTGVNSVIGMINGLLERIKNLPTFGLEITWFKFGEISIPVPKLVQTGTIGDKFNIPDIPSLDTSEATRNLSAVTFNGPVYYLSREEILQMLKEAQEQITQWNADFN